MATVTEWNILNDRAGEVGDLLLGTCCAGCGGVGRGVCDDCASHFWAQPRQVATASGVPVFALAEYSAPLDQVLIAHKERANWQLATPLGQRLAAAIQLLQADHQRIEVVPVPSSATAIRQRGYDHSHALARAAIRTIVPQFDNHLRVVRRLTRDSPVSDQSAMDRTERWRNQSGTMRARAGAHPLVVIDDICTTGATLHEAVHRLQGAGCQVIGCAVLAHTPNSASPAVGPDGQR